MSGICVPVRLTQTKGLCIGLVVFAHFIYINIQCIRAYILYTSVYIRYLVVVAQQQTVVPQSCRIQTLVRRYFGVCAEDYGATY